MRTQSKTGVLRRAGYSLVEVLVAAGIIAMGVGAAVTLAATTNSQEETGQKIARALSVAECAARLFRLGLSGDELKRLIPKDPIVLSMTVTEDTPSVAGVGTVERATITIVYELSPLLDPWQAEEWGPGVGGSGGQRSFTIQALRPTVKAGYN